MNHIFYVRNPIGSHQICVMNVEEIVSRFICGTVQSNNTLLA